MRLPVTLPLRRSRRLAAALALAHLLAAAGLLATDLPLLVRLPTLPVLAWSLLRSVRRVPFAALTLAADGRLALISADGSALECAVDASSTVLPWLVVLRLRTPQGSTALTLPVDALGAEGHRLLRVWLRWKANSEPA